MLSPLPPHCLTAIVTSIFSWTGAFGVGVGSLRIDFEVWKGWMIFIFEKVGES